MTVGAATYWYLPADDVALLVPPAAVTVTWTVPVPAGAVTVTSVAEMTLRLVAGLEPKWTPATPMKLLPWMVTLVPPLAGPLAGDTDVRVGAAGVPVAVRGRDRARREVLGRDLDVDSARALRGHGDLAGGGGRAVGRDQGGADDRHVSPGDREEARSVHRDGRRVPGRAGARHHAGDRHRLQLGAVVLAHQRGQAGIEHARPAASR